MKTSPSLACVLFLLATLGCSVEDSGPTETTTSEIDAGKAETVHAEIHMGAGSLKIEGGAANLMSGSFRYSERMGRPTSVMT